MCVVEEKYVSFLSSLGYFPCGKIFSFILHIFGPIYRRVIPTFFSIRINNIESLNFVLVLERTI